jgi:hypothetical protein
VRSTCCAALARENTHQNRVHPKKVLNTAMEPIPGTRRMAAMIVGRKYNVTTITTNSAIPAFSLALRCDVGGGGSVAWRIIGTSSMGVC